MVVSILLQFQIPFAICQSRFTESSWDRRTFSLLAQPTHECRQNSPDPSRVLANLANAVRNGSESLAVTQSDNTLHMR